MSKVQQKSEAPSTTSRELGLWMSTALVVGNVIGMGIFLLPSGLAPYGLNSLYGWTLMLLGCLALARVFSHLARAFPGADGPYDYVRNTLGDAPAFFAMWCYWISVWCTNAVLAVGVVGYLAELVPPLANVPPALIGLALVWLFVGVNVLGVRTGGGVQVATTALTLLPLVAVVVLGLWVLLTEPAAYTRTVPSTPLSMGMIMAASTTALYAMLGFESATVPAGRVKNPSITIPRATLLGTLLTAGLYIVVSTVPMLLLPQAELAASKAPFVDLFDRLSAPGVGRFLAFFVVISGVGCLNGWTLVSGEVTRSLANHGVLPRMLGDTNRRGAPGKALLVTGILATVMVLMNYSKQLVEGFVFVTNIVTAANLPRDFLSSVALFVLWRRAGGTARNQLLLALLGVAFAIFAAFGMGAKPSLWALALAAAGGPVYLAMRWWRGREVNT